MKQKGIRLNTLILLMCLSVTMLVLISTLWLFSQSYQNMLIRTARTASRRTVDQVAGTVNNYLSEIESVMDILEEPLEDPEIDRDAFFAMFLQSRPDVTAVSLYGEDGKLMQCFSRVGKVAFQGADNLSFNAARAAEYDDGYISPPHVETFFARQYPWVITMISPLTIESGKIYVALDISCSNLSAYINDSGIGHQGYCYLVDTEGNIVFHPQQQLIYSSLKEENIETVRNMEAGDKVEGQMIYTVQPLSHADWKIVGVSSFEEIINENLQDLLRFLLLAAALILIIMTLVSYLSGLAVSRPLKELETAMRQFEEDADHFQLSTRNVGTREVRNLEESFDHMVGRIQTLMGQVRQEEIDLRKTELRALQAQINPHFLYNTLDSISWMCEQGKNEEAVKMVNALAKLFRISISRGHELIPIRDELQHARSYLEIQSQRYRNQFSYDFQVEEDCLDFLCNKITLQPLLENAIYHGINGLVDDGEIIVSVKRDGEDILFTVSDNGSGMTQEQIDAIMQKEMSDRVGIGIKNVNDRLKIYFGSPYGITIDSEPDEGTRVYVRMPQVTEEAPRENI